MSTRQQNISWAPSARAQEIPRRLPQPLTPESLQGLMREPAYWDATHPRFPTYQRLVKRGFEILYPGPVRRSDTGNMIDTPPLAPHIVAKQVDAVNFEMESLDARAAGRREDSGRPPAGALKDNMVHVEAHVRNGGKTEVSDYWRNAPGHGDGSDKGAPENQNDPGQDTLPGQPGEDDLAEANPPKDAFVVPKEKLRDMRETWIGTRQGPNAAEKFQCVGLVKEAVPEIGSTKTWREGRKILGSGNPPLPPGTAIANFDEDGKYLSLPTGNHAAIFLKYDNRDGQDGILVLDQDRNRPIDERFIPFNRPGASSVNRAESYSVIKKGN